MAVPPRALRVRPRAVRRRGGRGQAPRLAGQARPRGRLRAREARRDDGSSWPDIRGTTCSARSTSWTAAGIDREPSLVDAVGVEAGVAPLLRELGNAAGSGLFDVARPSRPDQDLRHARSTGTADAVAEWSARRRLPGGLQRRAPQAAREALSESRACCGWRAQTGLRSRSPPTPTSRRTSAGTSTARSSTRAPPATRPSRSSTSAQPRQEPLG